jgi:hypothetical protein
MNVLFAEKNILLKKIFNRVIKEYKHIFNTTKYNILTE